MMGAGASEMVGVWFLLLGGMGLPLGLPPEPEDPLMARIAPADCLVYATWAGMTKPDPTSTNETERLLAEPDVQRALRGIEKMIRQAVDGGGRNGPGFGPGPGPEGALALEWGVKIATHQGAVFVSQFDPAQKKIEAGAILRLGEEDAASLKRLLIQMQQQGPLMVTEKKIGGESFFRVTMKEPDAPPITWGVRKGYVLFGVGENALEGMLVRAAKTDVPAWLVAARKKAGVERLSSLAYVNVKAIMALAGPEFAKVLPPEAAKAAGLGNLTDVVSATGLDKTGFVNRTVLGIDGEPEGLVAALIDEPLTAADLGPIPADASLAFAGRLNLEKVFKKIVQIAGEVDPRAAQMMEAELRNMERETGVDVRGELLPGLGDVWRGWISPSEGGWMAPTITVSIRDRDRVQNALASVERLTQGGPRGLRVIRERFGNQEICTLRMPMSPVAPSWCVTDKELVFSTFPQNIRGYLRRGTGHRSLSTVPEVAAALEGGASAVTYADTKQLFEAGYPWVQLFLTMASNSTDENFPFQFDASILPPLSALSPHLKPSVGVVRKGSGGIELTTRQTFPGAGLTSLSPVTLALLMPAVATARMSASNAQSMNNLKQIMLAFHNHADTFQSFPGAFTMKADEKPLLSWRVRLLPFLEQQQLFQQFKLDEPWDSENNKALLESMPAVFRDPRSNAPPGHTTYLGVRGKSGTFEKGDLVENGKVTKPGGLKFQNITDGTSNTIAVVEVTDEFAVPWTKPDDFDFAMANFQKVLFGNRPGFIAAFLDGHVEMIHALSDKQLKAFFTRDGGEVIDRTGEGRGFGVRGLDARDDAIPADDPQPMPRNPVPTKKPADLNPPRTESRPDNPPAVPKTPANPKATAQPKATAIPKTPGIPKTPEPALPK